MRSKLDSGPLADALVAWHMSGSEGETTAEPAVQGAVQLGVPLHGAERDASLARGGSGTVAQFAGGYLRAAGPGGRGLRGDAMSLCMRLRDPTGRWDAPLFARDDRDDALASILYGADGAAKPLHYGGGERGPATPWYHLFAEQDGPYRLAGSRALLEYRWRTRPAAPVIGFNEDGHADDPILGEARAGVLRLGVPVALIGATAWHDVVFRFRGPNLELFVDGVLVDEEWGYGALHRFEPPFLIGAGWNTGELATGFRGQIDHVALWDRALSDAEIARLSGGAAAVERRTVEILGPERPVPHHWRPRGYNVYAGDCMLLWDGARLHLFYLFDRRAARGDSRFPRLGLIGRRASGVATGGGPGSSLHHRPVGRWRHRRPVRRRTLHGCRAARRPRRFRTALIRPRRRGAGVGDQRPPAPRRATHGAPPVMTSDSGSVSPVPRVSRCPSGSAAGRVARLRRPASRTGS